MTFEEYLDHRRKKLFTPGEVAYLLEKCGYQYLFLDTLVPEGATTWPSGSGRKCQKSLRNTLEKRKVPKHFAYIKFYMKSKGDTPYALVAGKTNRINDGRPDFEFKRIEHAIKDIDYEQADKAKFWLWQENYQWYCSHVLIVWSKDPRKVALATEDRELENLALSIEADIGGLLGLFKS